MQTESFAGEIFTKEHFDEVKFRMGETLALDRYNLFINNLELVKVSGDKIFISTPRHGNIDILKNNFAFEMEDFIRDITKTNFKCDFVLEGTKIDDSSDSHMSLNPKYSFDEFVVGVTNELALNAAKGVAESESATLNPLFLYGNVGLGKTHLIQAIGNRIAKRNPAANICYITSENFLNDFTKSLMTNTTSQFRKKYRNVDVLLMDDIQFFSDKETIKEELFNTFNWLYSKNKHIVFSSDRKPAELKGIEKRLVSRFAGGLIIEIAPPDYEIRVAILKKKLENRAIDVPTELLDYIARAVTTNIRELEGCFNTFIQICILTNSKPSVHIADQAISQYISSNSKKKISISDIKELVADYFHVSVSDIDDKKRTKKIVTARHVAMFIARSVTNLSLPQLGDNFGGRDHSTVHSAIEKITEKMKTDSDLAAAIGDIKEKINKYQIVGK